jgi:hypothetical protein
MKTRRAIREEQGKTARHIGRRVVFPKPCRRRLPESNGLLPDVSHTCRHPLSPAIVSHDTSNRPPMDKKRILVSMSYLEHTEPPLPYRTRDAPKNLQKKSASEAKGKR